MGELIEIEDARMVYRSTNKEAPTAPNSFT